MAAILHFYLFVQVQSIGVEDFYAFGNATGDQRLPRTLDGSSPLIVLRTPFPFYDQDRRLLYVSSILAAGDSNFLRPRPAYA